jgi:hypothetical protein
MWGVTTKHFKFGMLLLAATIALSLVWSYLPHLVFIISAITVGFVAVAYTVSHDAFRQASLLLNDAPPLPPPRPSATVKVANAPASARGRRSAAAGARAKKRGEVLNPDATVTLSDERAAADVDDVFASLDRELVGLIPVKKKVEEIASLLLVDRVRQRFGLTAPRPNLHMCFTGEPGTGKTTVALKMADLLRRLGYLESGHLVHAMRDDLVGEFIGHTAPKTKRVLERAMGGVLFIDEAYYLYRASDSKDYGQECIDILL